MKGYRVISAVESLVSYGRILEQAIPSINDQECVVQASCTVGIHMANKQPYIPPYEMTNLITHCIADISEGIGRIMAVAETPFLPKLRRENRIKTIQASLAIENNSLTLEQVTDVIDGKRVLGNPKEIQEVRNAFAAYEALNDWEPGLLDDLLSAHAILMKGLTDEAGRLRKGGVGVFAGKKVVHMAPPAKRVPGLVADLLDWIKKTDEHPLVTSCVFHYELEFIHPFTDGNGRMGRLWQTLILQKWKQVFAWLPVETVIKERQAEYYQVLAKCDKEGKSTLFIEFILKSLVATLAELSESDQVADHVSDQVKGLVKFLGRKELGALELMGGLKLSHRPTFRKNYLTPALEGGWVERDQPDSPRSPNQRYRLTSKGERLLRWLDSK